MTEAGMSKGARPAGAAEYPGKLISAASIASPFQSEISKTIATRRSQGKRIPRLVGILATPSPPSVAYAEWTKKACEQVGIEFEIWKTWEDAEEGTSRDGEVEMEGIEEDRALSTDLEADVEELIIAANANDDIHGIMVYYPIFGGRQDTYLQQILDPRKDVEGLHFSYCWNMYHNVRWVIPSQVGAAPGKTLEVGLGPFNKEDVVPAGFAKSILPCTPLAVVKCLEAMEVYDGSLPYGDRLFGKVITVINRSEVVGRPLAALLSNDGAKVYSVDLDSVQEFNKRATIEKNRRPSGAVLQARKENNKRRLRPHHVVHTSAMTMQQCIEASDVVISGVPSANFKIKTDWVKEGAITINFSSEKNFEKDVRRRASKHLPAIGKTTIVMLQRNLLRLVQYRELSAVRSSMGGDEGGPRGGGGGDATSKGNNGGGGYFGGQNDTSNRFDGPPNSRPNGGDDDSGGHSGNYRGPSSSTSNQAAAHQERRVSSMEHDLTKERKENIRASHSPPVRIQIQSHPFSPVPGFASRGRASTMSLPHVDRARDRLPSISQLSPVYPHPPQTASTASISNSSSSLWDWRQATSRRDSAMSGKTTSSIDYPSTYDSFHNKNAALPSTQQSPLLFASIGPYNPPSHPHSTIGRPLLSTSTYAASSPRSATPISPLFIDNLSVEDTSNSSNPSVRASWDFGTPRTPREGQMPSVLERPTKDFPQRMSRGGYPSSIGQEKSMPIQKVDPSIMSPPNLALDFNGGVVMKETLPQAAAPDQLISQSRRRRRPPFSYSSLIAQAITSSPENRMTLREIYTWISNAYPELYSMEGSEGSGWQNTVRHNLSLNKSFVKVARTAQDIYESCSSGLPNMSQAARGKGGWWTLDQSVAQAQLGLELQGEGTGEDDDSTLGDYVGTLHHSSEPQRRRRRTNSFANSARSPDEVAPSSSPTGLFVPSVLQIVSSQGRGSGQSGGDGMMPSVLQSRTSSAERSMAHADREMAKYEDPRRPRGYTMGDAESRRGRYSHSILPPPPTPSPQSTPPFASSSAHQRPTRPTMPSSSSSYTNASKRKIRFDGQPEDSKGAFLPLGEEQQQEQQHYQNVTMDPSAQMKPSFSPVKNRTALPPSHPLQQSTLSMSSNHSSTTKSNAIYNGKGNGRMSIHDLLT
ncbi:hypothetical protein CBS101457_004810 [Exobasidium rhododendri]|nr:hypothetical protein CBS101457_004810 [Exobasidium rhododendri]